MKDIAIPQRLQETISGAFTLPECIVLRLIMLGHELLDNIQYSVVFANNLWLMGGIKLPTTFLVRFLLRRGHGLPRLSYTDCR